MILSKSCKLVIAVLAVVGTTLISGFTNAQDRPNILFVISDDQSYETLGHLDLVDVETPNLDRLARRGTSFTHCYNMGSWSGAVCVASRTMLNTGRFIWNAQAAVPKLSDEHKAGRLWSDMLGQAGYRTYITGKWHVAIKADQIFDMSKHIRPGMPNQTPEGYNRPPLKGEDPWSPWDKSREGFWKDGKHWTEVVADDAIEFISDAQSHDEPFFMYVAFNSPHDPRQAPRKFVEKYPLERVAIPENFLADYPYKNQIGCSPKLRDEKLAPFPRSEHAVKVHRGEYFACITHLDQQIGRIFDALEEQGLDDSTWIIFTSDHGLAVGRHGLFGKQNMYQHSVRVPFIISAPGQRTSSSVTTPIYLQDAMATTLDIADAENTSHVEFKSLLPLMSGEKAHHGDIYGAYLDKQRMICDGKWKLIVYPEVPICRLYQVAEDPHELKDLADNVENHETIKRLFGELVDWQKEHGDKLDLSAAFPDLAK